MASNFEDFYKAVKQLVDEDQEATEEQKAALFKGVESAKPYIDILSAKDEELGITQEEAYVLSYLVGHRPEEGQPKTAYEETLIQLVSMMFVHDKKDIILELYNDEAARLTFIKSLTNKDLEELKLDKSDEKVAALLKSESPSLDDLLDVIGFGNMALLYERHNKYRTKAKAREAGAITEAPKTLVTPTLSGYQYSMSLYQDGGAYLQPLTSMDGLQFKKGKLYFSGARMQEVSEAELRDLRTKQDIQDLDLTTLRFYYSLLFDQFQRSGYKVLQDFIIVSVPVLAGRNDPKAEDINAVIAKVQSYHNVMGVIKGKTPTGKPAESYYQVLNFEYYDKKHNIIAFSSPYMNYVIKTIYNLSIRKDKSGKPKLKRSGEPLTLPTHSYLIDSSIVKERNKAAAENVVILVTLIEQAGDNIPRIKASTLIERNVQLAERLEAAKNPRTLLKTTFTKTWELLKTKTRLTEFYKNIQLPEPNDPAFMPTMRTLDKVVFTFPHDGKKK